MILGQLYIFNQNIAEFEGICGIREGCFARIVVGVLKNNCVTLQPPFDKNILSNDCYKFEEKGNKIIDEIEIEFQPYITTEMRDVVGDTLNK